MNDCNRGGNSGPIGTHMWIIKSELATANTAMNTVYVCMYCGARK